MYGLSGRQWMASISSSRRAVSRASGVPLARAETAFPFNALAGLGKVIAPGDLAFFVVAMLLFPRARRLRQNDGRVFSVHPQDRQGRRWRIRRVDARKLVSFVKKRYGNPVNRRA